MINIFIALYIFSGTQPKILNCNIRKIIMENKINIFQDKYYCIKWFNFDKIHIIKTLSIPCCMK